MEKIALIFPGQGSQYVEMYKKLYEEYHIARDTFQEANDILGIDLAKLCLCGSLTELSEIKNVLPALFTVSVIAYRIYMKEIGIKPHFMAGHSLGEYSAICCSGALEFSDALKIVRNRANFAHEFAKKGIGAMSIITNIDVAVIEKACSKLSDKENIVSISCYNSSREVAISGHCDLVQKIEDIADDEGAIITPLMGAAPFHCLLMSSVADELKKELNKFKYNQFKCPVVSNVTASIYEGPEHIVNSLTDQIISPVKWKQTMDFLHDSGITMAIEMGPKNVLGNLFKSYSGVKSLSFDHTNDRKELFDLFENRRAYQLTNHRFITKCMATSIATPNYNINYDQYRQGVIEPYRKLEKMKQELEKTNGMISKDNLKQALGLLETILRTKGISKVEQDYWVYQVLDETGKHYAI